MSKSFYLLTAFGKDRSGMVTDLTRAVVRAKGTIEDASMTRLGGEFAMMLMVGLPNAGAGVRFQKEAAALQKKSGLLAAVKPVAAGLAHAKRQSQPTHLISIYGTDRPGIVYRVAETVSHLGLSITDLNTRVLSRSGKPLYLMLLEVHIPSRAKAAALDRNLKRLGRTLKLNVTLQDINPVSL